MEFRFLAGIDQGPVVEQVRQAMLDVEIHEGLLAEILVADDLAAAIAEVQESDATRGSTCPKQRRRRRTSEV